MTKLWFKKWPKRLEFELAELEKRGIAYEFDSDAFDKGLVVLHLTHILNSKELKLIARFPDLYPYFRFEVTAENLDLPRHQHPFEKNLCLIGRSTINWNAQHDNLAKFIIEQLPIAIKSAQNGNSDLEEPQGEPLSEYYPKSLFTVMIDSDWKLDLNIKQGTLQIGTKEDGGILRSVVLNIHDTDGNIIASGFPEFEKMYSLRQEIQWVRSDEFIRLGDPKEFYEYLLKTYPHLRQAYEKYDPILKFHYHLIGVVFPEEVKYKTIADGWVFVLMRYTKSKGKKRYSFCFVRATRAGRKDFLERIPTVSFMKNKVIAIAGLGSIGAPSALEFARLGVKEIRILDDDDIEPGNIMRWPLGISANGVPKVKMLAMHMSNNYPYTKVVEFFQRLGAIPCKNASLPEKLQTDTVEEFLDGVDLVFDATAEIGVHHILSQLASEKNIPYILAYATQGAWGGEVARFFPNRRSCWACYERAHFEGKIKLPPADPNGKVQPTACSNPTFTGVNFDLQELVLMGVRLAVSTFSPGDNSDYPKIDWNIAQLSMRENGKLIPPKWEIIQLTPYSDCICANGE